MVNGRQAVRRPDGADKVVNPSNAQYKNGPEAPGDFAKGKAAMMMSQNNADNTLQADGMKPSDSTASCRSRPRPAAKDIASFVAGINLSIFKNTKNKDAALKFVKFMTSPEEQETLDKPFTALPVRQGRHRQVHRQTRRRRRRSRTSWPPSPSRCRWCPAESAVRDQRRQRHEQPVGPGRHRARPVSDGRHQGRAAGGAGQDGRGRQLTRRPTTMTTTVSADTARVEAPSRRQRRRRPLSWGKPRRRTCWCCRQCCWSC